MIENVAMDGKTMEFNECSAIISEFKLKPSKNRAVCNSSSVLRKSVFALDQLKSKKI